MTEISVSYSDESHVLRVIFSNPDHVAQISFNVIMDPMTSIFSGEETKKFLDLLSKSEMACEGSMLHLQWCTVFPHGDVVSWVEDYVTSRKSCGTPVNFVKLIFEKGEKPSEGLENALRDAVPSVEIVYEDSETGGPTPESPEMKSPSLESHGVDGQLKKWEEIKGG